MGRMYVLSNTIATFTGPKTIFELGAATNTTIIIHRMSLTQSTSEVDDSTLITYGTYTASGTGTPITANVEALDPGDTAYGGTAEDDHSVDITTGEIVLGREGASLLAGYHKVFLPEERPVCPGAIFFALNTIDAVTSVTLVYEVVFEEIG
jgi:hypothetical protein